MPQCIFAHLSNRRAAEKHAPYRTIPKPRTSAERGQENGQRDYRAPSVQRSNHLRSKGRRTATRKSAPKSPLFLLHRARRSSFSPRTEKKKRGVHPHKREGGASQQRNGIPKRRTLSPNSDACRLRNSPAGIPLQSKIKPGRPAFRRGAPFFIAVSAQDRPLRLRISSAAALSALLLSRGMVNSAPGPS